MSPLSRTNLNRRFIRIPAQRARVAPEPGFQASGRTRLIKARKRVSATAAAPQRRWLAAHGDNRPRHSCATRGLLVYANHLPRSGFIEDVPASFCNLVDDAVLINGTTRPISARREAFGSAPLSISAFWDAKKRSICLLANITRESTNKNRNPPSIHHINQQLQNGTNSHYDETSDLVKVTPKPSARRLYPFLTRSAVPVVRPKSFSPQTLFTQPWRICREGTGSCLDACQSLLERLFLVRANG